MDKVTLRSPAWTTWDPVKHKRGPKPQCSRPGCQETPTMTRYSERLRSGAVATQRHVYCDEHGVEQRNKDAALQA